ncbi:colipase-like protein 2 [Camelus dromedarius]|uniref:colipase-like protein 2 n=1 Tax=Camelus dromedarius TaxID=9838 RepID=UPI00057B9CA3
MSPWGRRITWQRRALYTQPLRARRTCDAQAHGQAPRGNPAPLLGHVSRPLKRGLRRCFHHSECFSDCCLISLNHGGAFCAPKARVAMMCLPQTRGNINIICPCQRGLSCTSKDSGCARRCHLI